MDELHEHYEIMSELFTLKDMPAFRFVFSQNDLKIIGAWDVISKYHPRNQFNIEMEELAKRVEGKKHNDDFHKQFNLEEEEDDK